MIFAANFKTNHTRTSTVQYIMQMQEMLDTNPTNHQVMIFPPVSALLPSTEAVKVGTQNAWHTQNGAYTGEIGLEQLAEFDIDTILIGHSERRNIIGESQELLAQKFDYFAKNNFLIIYCIGEPLEVREAGEEAVAEYLWAQFNGIDIDYNRLIVAYEPVWAIGTGRSATVDEINSTHNELRKRVKAPLLYGGSVNKNNIVDICKVSNVDGVLVGSASLDAKNFYEMMRLVN